MRMTIEPFLLDVDLRAGEKQTKAFVHVVGLGLGAWMMTERQGQIQLEIYADLLQSLELQNTAHIEFSWFPDDCDCCGGKVPTF